MLAVIETLYMHYTALRDSAGCCPVGRAVIDWGYASREHNMLINALCFIDPVIFLSETSTRVLGRCAFNGLVYRRNVG